MKMFLKKALFVGIFLFCQILSATVIELSNATSIPESSLPIVIDIYGNHCQPCKRMAPIFAELSDEFAGRALFVKIESSQQLASSFGIYSIPTFIFYKNGAEVFRQIGAMPKSELRRLIQKLIAA